MDNLQAALAYYEHGFPVIPIKPGDKQPLIAWKSYQDQKPTETEIREWWAKTPDANIGLLTNDMLVIDADTPDAVGQIEAMIPDLSAVPTQSTPRGGRHYFFQVPENLSLTTGTGFLPGADFRCKGGLIVVEPSMNGNGRGYQWLPGRSIFALPLPSVPDALLKALLYNNISIYKGCRQNVDTPLKDASFFTEGRRDDDLFRIANALVKENLPEELIIQAIEMLALNCNPPFPLHEAKEKIRSAYTRSDRRDRTLAADVREWVLSTNGVFLSTDVHNCLQLSTRDDKKNVSIILKRMVDDGEIERHGSKNGQFRRVDTSIEFLNFAGADLENYIDLRLPLGIHTKTKFFPKAVITVNGVSGQGKTLFALNTIAENMGRFPIYYFNSEMGPEALRMKISYFPIPISDWAKHMKVIDNWDFNNIADKIQPDAFNVIDYLEPEGEKAFNIHGVISAIIRRLDKGTALISIQKKPDARLGTGGVYSIKAATLALALDWGKIEIVKNRFREEDPFPSLNKINFDVHQGHKFVKQGNWYK